MYATSESPCNIQNIGDPVLPLNLLALVSSNYLRNYDKISEINHSFSQLENYTYKYNFTFEFTACTFHNRKMLFLYDLEIGINKIRTYRIWYIRWYYRKGNSELLHNWKMLKNFYLLFTFISCRKIILDSRKCHPFRRLYMAYVCGPAFPWYVEIYSLALSPVCKK